MFGQTYVFSKTSHRMKILSSRVCVSKLQSSSSPCLSLTKFPALTTSLLRHHQIKSTLTSNTTTSWLQIWIWIWEKTLFPLRNWHLAWSWMENVALCRYFDSRLPGKIPTVLELRVKQDISGIDHATLPILPKSGWPLLLLDLLNMHMGKFCGQLAKIDSYWLRDDFKKFFDDLDGSSLHNNHCIWYSSGYCNYKDCYGKNWHDKIFCINACFSQLYYFVKITRLLDQV